MKLLDIDKFFADSFPVVVSTTTEIDEGENLQLDTQSLSNYFDTPMAIDEIRVQIVAPPSNTFVVNLANFGGSVKLKLTMGRYALTDVYVPVGCFGTTFEGAVLDSATVSPGYNPESLSYGFTLTSYVGYFRWKLPRPLVVPVGTPLEAKLSRSTEGLAQIFSDEPTLSVNVAYVGRVAKKNLPSGITIPVPYVGLFENVFTSASVAVSDQLDLYNPFQAPLNVQRLIGRWQTIYLDSANTTNCSIGLDWTNVGGTNSVIQFPLTQLRTFDGFNITNGYIPGLAIFEGNTRSTVTNIQLARSEGIEATIDATAGVPSTQAEGSAYNGSNTSYITMIGWRNEEL